MKRRLGLLYTRDRNFDRVLSEALFGTGAIVLIARSVGDALQVVSSRGRELDFAILDFNDGCRGMTLLSAVRTCYECLPILVTTSKDSEHASFLAYANGARTCLKKPLSAAGFAKAIADVTPARRQPLSA
jgi:DNA-binding response OmpR family regulator